MSSRERFLLFSFYEGAACSREEKRCKINWAKGLCNVRERKKIGSNDSMTCGYYWTEFIRLSGSEKNMFFFFLRF